MNRKSIYLLFLFFLLFSKAKSQKAIVSTNCCCSNFIEQISDEWKKDFADSSNYRLSNYKSLMTCKIDTLFTNYILDKLGKPESIGYNNKEIEYRYYFFRDGSMSGKGMEEIIGISMTFSKDKNRLIATELILNDF